MSANPIEIKGNKASAAGGGPGPSLNPELSKISFDDDDLVWVQDENNRNWFPGLITEQNEDNTYNIQFNQEPHQGVPIDRISEFELDIGADVIVLNKEEDKFSNDNFKNGKISGINDKNKLRLNTYKYDVIYDDNIRETNIILNHLAETDAQMLLNKGLFTSDFFKRIVAEFDRLGEKAVSKLQFEQVEFETKENTLEYMLSPIKIEKTYYYTSKDKDLDWYFKRVWAKYYINNKNLDFNAITEQVYRDLLGGHIIRLPNNNEDRFRFKKSAGLLKYYNYIIKLVDSLSQIPNGFNKADLVDMFFCMPDQNFVIKFFELDTNTLLIFLDGQIISINQSNREKVFLLEDFLYGNLKKYTHIYDPINQTINIFETSHINSVNAKNSNIGFKLVNSNLQMNLKTKALILRVTYNKPFVLYQHGVYIGETIHKIDGLEQDRITFIANGQGIFYIYDYKIAGDYPRAKLYGTFENGSLKKDASVGIEFYDSMEDFNAKTFLNDGEKAGGVMAALDRQQYNGTVIIYDDIQLDNVDYEYLLLLDKKKPLESENLFDPNGYFMKYKIGPYYTTDLAKYKTNPFKISDILDLPEDFKGEFHKTLIHNRENNLPLSITLESKKGKTVYDILGFMFFPTIDVIRNTPLHTLFSIYFTDKVNRDITRGQSFAINKDGNEYKETGKYWGIYDSNRIDVYKKWLHEKLLDIIFTTEIERENYINAVFYASQQFMDIMSNYFNNENLQYQPISKDFINVFYTNRKIISIGRKYFLAMSNKCTLFDDYISKFNTLYCGTLAITVEYNLKEGICKILITPILETYFKLGNKAGGKYVGQTQKQKVSNDENELEIENFIPNGKGKMYFYLADETNPDDQFDFSDKQLTMTLETDKWANGDLLKGTRVKINYIDNLRTNPEYKGRVFNIELSQELSLNSIINDGGLNFIESEIKNYKLKITKITKERADVKAVEDAVKKGNYLRPDNRLGNKSHQGIVLFADTIADPSNATNYVYIGPILPNDDKTVSISKKYGKILQFSKDTNIKPNVNVSDKKYTVFIKPGKENSRDWDHFVLKPNFSKNYLEYSELPLEWSIVRFGSVFDNFKFSLSNNSLGQKGIASELVTRVFRDLMVDPIANDLSLTKGLFEDTQRVFKMEKMIYIQVLIYFKILFVLLKRYDSNLISLPGYVSMKGLLNKLYEDYDSFTEFNQEVSDDYKYDTTNSPDSATSYNIDEELNTAPVSTLLSPIISSMDPKTNTSVFEPINQNIDDLKLLPVYVLKAALLVLQNLGIVLQMYMSILGRMPVDEDANIVANYNPFLLYPMYQKIQNVYNDLYRLLPGTSNDDVETLTKHNSATINKYLVSLALRIGASSSLMSYGGYMSRKNKHKSHKRKFSKRNSKNGITTRNYNCSKRERKERELRYTRKL
jgi:hypothetical protein